jgi:hypothetical protein
MENYLNRILAGLGILSLILIVFDFLSGMDRFGSLLAIAWSLLFIYMGVKNFITARYEPRIMSGIQAALIIYIVIAGFSNILMKL